MGTATNSPPAIALKKALSLKRIGWLYPIFRDLHFYHGLLARPRAGGPPAILVPTARKLNVRPLHASPTSCRGQAGQLLKGDGFQHLFVTRLEPVKLVFRGNENRVEELFIAFGRQQPDHLPLLLDG